MKAAASEQRDSEHIGPGAVITTWCVQSYLIRNPTKGPRRVLVLEVSPIVQTGNGGTKTCKNAFKIVHYSVHPGLRELEPGGVAHMVSHSLFPQSHCDGVYSCHCAACHLLDFDLARV